MAFGSPTMITTDKARANFATNREDPDFETGIGLLDPNENPFTLATMDMGKRSSQTVDFHWFEDELVPETDTVNGAITTTITALVVDNGDRFVVGDLVMVNRTREVVLVTTISSDTLTVVRDYGQGEGWTTQLANIDDGAVLTRVGTAYEQGHPLPSRQSTQEVENKNYCQDQRTPMGISEIADASAQRGRDDWPFQQEKGGISHMRKLEYMNFWGKPYVGDKGLYVSGTGNTLPTAAGGINHFIVTNSLSAQKLDETELTQDEFQDFMEPVFEFGSRIKFCYCPPRLRTALDKWGITKLNSFVTDTMFGIAVGRWVSSHGEVVFITHKMLNNADAPTNDWFYAFFLDMEEVKWVTLQERGSTRLRDLDPYKATGATIMQKEFQTIGGIKFGLGPKHSRLRFKNIAA